ncbi:amidophosphoribosyltransferase [Phycisphaerales bacterium ac7]
MAGDRPNASVSLPVLNREAGVLTPGKRFGSGEAAHAHEKCGIFGVWGAAHPARLSYFGLFSLQHRGQESAGIVTTNGRRIMRKAGMGLVASVFSPADLKELDEFASDRIAIAGESGGGIGHNRYSTTGASADANTQPFTGHYRGGPVAIAHNGNVTNAIRIRRDLENAGHAFHGSSDTEVMFQLIAAMSSQDGSDDPLADALAQFEGAFSILLLGKDRIEAARDPWGWRPLVIGRLPEDETGRRPYIITSETIALDVVGAEFIREVEPGEIVTIGDDGLTSRRFCDPVPRRAHCVFEHVYFASPASNVFGNTVQRVREQLGERLAIEAPVQADAVLPMPDSGRSAATGFARRSGLPYREGIIPNRYVGRTFIKPTTAERVDAVRLKLNVISEVVKGQRIVIVDDSIVRGTTTKAKMDQLRAAGAKEIHLRISCPPITHPCYFGVDFASRDQLIAAQHDLEEIRRMLGVDSLHYLTLEGLLDVAKSDTVEPEHYCTACYSGDYRISVDPKHSKEILEANC